jgi:hypothetical protein
MIAEHGQGPRLCETRNLRLPLTESYGWENDQSFTSRFALKAMAGVGLLPLRQEIGIILRPMGEKQSDRLDRVVSHNELSEVSQERVEIEHTFSVT